MVKEGTLPSGGKGGGQQEPRLRGRCGNKHNDAIKEEAFFDTKGANYPSLKRALAFDA